MDAALGAGVIDWAQAIQRSSRRVIRHRDNPPNRPAKGPGREGDLTPDDPTTTGRLKGVRAHRLGAFAEASYHGPLPLGIEASGRPASRRRISTGLGDGGLAIVPQPRSGGRA